jgi:hypothetical protein
LAVDHLIIRARRRRNAFLDPGAHIAQSLVEHAEIGDRIGAVGLIRGIAMDRVLCEPKTEAIVQTLVDFDRVKCSVSSGAM